VTRWGFTTVTKQEPEASTEIHDIDGSMVAREVWGMILFVWLFVLREIYKMMVVFERSFLFCFF
jgi:hypothetical protein